MEEERFERLLKICRIKLTESEKTAIKKDIDEVIEYFNMLDSVDVGSTEPAYHPIEVEGKLREDKVVAYEDVIGLLKNTKTYRFYVVGPKI
jgi:aspartyl/glutamyl-tRNA(Asn/Gln) amidotransferase C subunit